MKERIGLQRKKVATPVIANLSLVSSEQQIETAMSSGTGFSGHDLSRISPRYQAKLSVSQPGDTYEREADSIAQKVMGMGDRSIQQQATSQEDEQVQLKSVGELITPLVQREEIPEEEEEKELQMKPDGNFAIQRDGNSSLAADNDISDKLHSRQGGGSPLSDDVRSFMEPRFGVDFSNVKVHTDGEAVQMARAVGAQAFAYGSDVYFGAGKAPGNNELTAHELTHVVQQTGGIAKRLNSIEAPYIQQTAVINKPGGVIQQPLFKFSQTSSPSIQRFDPLDYIPFVGKLWKTAKCTRNMKRVADIENQCKAEYSKNCDDDMLSNECLEFMDDTGYPSDAITKCVKTKDPKAYKNFLESCAKVATGSYGK